MYFYYYYYCNKTVIQAHRGVAPHVGPWSQNQGPLTTAQYQYILCGVIYSLYCNKIIINYFWLITKFEDTFYLTKIEKSIQHGNKHSGDKKNIWTNHRIVDMQLLSIFLRMHGFWWHRFKLACGFEYTSKLQRMFQDIGVSKDLNEQFKKHLSNSEPLDCKCSTLWLYIDSSCLCLECFYNITCMLLLMSKNANERLRLHLSRSGFQYPGSELWLMAVPAVLHIRFTI